MPYLHIQSLEALTDLLHAADHAERLDPQEVAEICRRAAAVLGELLERDIAPTRFDPAWPNS